MNVFIKIIYFQVHTVSTLRKLCVPFLSIPPTILAQFLSLPPPPPRTTARFPAGGLEALKSPSRPVDTAQHDTTQQKTVQHEMNVQHETLGPAQEPALEAQWRVGVSRARAVSVRWPAH